MEIKMKNIIPSVKAIKIGARIGAGIGAGILVAAAIKQIPLEQQTRIMRGCVVLGGVGLQAAAAGMASKEIGDIFDVVIEQLQAFGVVIESLDYIKDDLEKEMIAEMKKIDLN